MAPAFLIAAAALGGGTVTPTVAPPAPEAVTEPRRLRLTPPQMFRLADIASARNDPDTAVAVYSILSTNPDPNVRAEARFRQARQAVSEGRPRDAALLLRRLLDDKPDAAPVRLQLAQLLEGLGDGDGALRELRAAQATGLPTGVARLVDRYSEAVRAGLPAGASIEVAVAPDSNINNATGSETLGTVLGDFDIEPESKAKSGLGLSIRPQAFRRLSLGQGNRSLLVRASGSANLYKASRFNDVTADLAVGPELRFRSNRINLEVGLTQRWHGQKPSQRSGRLGATLSRPLGRRSQGRLNAFAALIDNQFNNLQDAKVYSGRVAVERALSSTTGVAASLQLDRQAARDAGYSTTGWRAGLLAWRDVGRATLTASADIGRLHADARLQLFPSKRADRYSRASIAATFRALAIGGFAPLVRLSVERNRSTIAFYDYRRMRTEFGVARAF